VIDTRGELDLKRRQNTVPSYPFSGINKGTRNGKMNKEAEGGRDWGQINKSEQRGPVNEEYLSKKKHF